MQQNDSFRKHIMRRILFFIILLNFIHSTILIEAAQQETWTVSLQITESSGKSTTLYFGGSPNATDDVDDLDRPEPPAPPEQSYIRAWFATSLPLPFNRLLREFKHIPSEKMVWNISVIWVSESEEESTTTVTFSWNSTAVEQSNFTSFGLYENNTMLADMLTQNTVSFPINNTLRHFQLIGQKSENIDSLDQNNLPIFPITAGIVALIIICCIAFLLYRRK
jgi:hypothetical protein